MRNITFLLSYIEYQVYHENLFFLNDEQRMLRRACTKLHSYLTSDMRNIFVQYIYLLPYFVDASRKGSGEISFMCISSESSNMYKILMIAKFSNNLIP